MYLSYCRVSTAEQAAEGTTSLDEQERKCRAVANLRGAGAYDFTCFRDVGVSGATPLSNRPGGSELINAANRGDTVLAVKMDRMFRSASDALKTAEHFKAAGVDLILVDLGVEPVTANGAAKMFFGMLALFAEFERERIAERMEDGRRGKRARHADLGPGTGTWVGGAPPLGYVKVGEGKLSTLAPNPDEQFVIARVLDLSRRHAPASVIKLLAHEGVTLRGHPVGHMQLKRITQRHHKPEQKLAARA